MASLMTQRCLGLGEKQQSRLKEGFCTTLNTQEYCDLQSAVRGDSGHAAQNRGGESMEEGTHPLTTTSCWDQVPPQVFR